VEENHSGKVKIKHTRALCPRTDLNTCGISHDFASIFTPKPSAIPRGMLSGSPPPVMCAIAFMAGSTGEQLEEEELQARAGRRHLM